MTAPLDPIGADARTGRRERRLAGNVCWHCGEADPRVLHRHHVAGRHVGPEAVICANCHQRTHGRMADAGIDLRATLTVPERAVEALTGVGVFLVQLGEFIIELAEQLGKFLAGLDVEYPAWRTMPEATP